jgi:penicillin-binding protein 1A
MAKRKDGDRREPYFEDDDDDDFRVSARDRPGVLVSDKKTKGKKSKKRREPEWDTEDGDPPQRGARKSSRGKEKKKSGSRSLLRGFLYWCLVCGIWGALGIAGTLTWYAIRLPPLSTLQVPERPPNIAILAADGSLLVNRGARGQAVKLKNMPAYLPKAVIAIEDRNFYSHFGIDPSGLARAIVSNLLARSVRQGGSTLTQQLAKNLFLTPERSMERKIQELILSLWLEAKFSKDQILEMYLNRVYLGAGTYGVEAASQRYFNKSVTEINLQEAAILAGLLKAPTHYAPTRSVEAALARAKLVLSAMVETGAITQAQADKAMAQKLSAAKTSSATSAINYAADWVLDLLPGFIETMNGDITVETTIDGKAQAAAEKALQSVLQQEGEKYNVKQGAVVAMSPSGAIEALVGGRSYQESQYNRAIVSKRQPGSAFKPFVYLAALEKGLSPNDRRDDVPLNIRGWRPENYSHEYRGLVTLREALALSLNTVSVRLALEVGPKAVVRVAQRLGITSDLNPNASIALGTSEVSLLELTRAYAPFANGGLSVVPYIVTRIKDTKGNILYERAPARSGIERVIAPENLAEMNDMLSSAVAFGTARRANVGDWPVAGKTGTSQDFRDGWFMGYTAHLVTGVWVGNDDDTPTKHASGSSLPIEIWNQVMAASHPRDLALALPGAERAARPPSAQEPTIDDILIGGFTGDEERNSAPSPVRPKDCPLDSGFLNCVFAR